MTLKKNDDTDLSKIGYYVLAILLGVVLVLVLIGIFQSNFRIYKFKGLDIKWWINKDKKDEKDHLNKMLKISQTLTQDREEVPWIGVEVTDVTLEVAMAAGLDKVKGALVKKVFSASPAEKAGILPGDIILSFNGRGIRNANEFENDLSGVDVGSEIKMCISREDYRTTVYAIAEPAPQWFTPETKLSPWIGFEVSEVSSESDEKRIEEAEKEGGVFVKTVAAGSPAEKAGIEPGDVLMSFQYRKVRTVKEFLTDLSGAEVGERVRICLIRGDIRKTVYPILEERPQNAPETFVSQTYTPDLSGMEWGVLLSLLTDSLREKYSIPAGINGVIVLEVEKGGIAQKSGFLPGDLITSINGKPVYDIQTFLKAYSSIEEGALVEIYRNQSFMYINIGSSTLGVPKTL